MVMRVTAPVVLLAWIAACRDAAPPMEPAGPVPTPVSGLEVVGSWPADGAVGVARAATVTVLFSEPVDRASVNAGSVGLWRGAEPVAVDLTVAEQSARLAPRALLDLNTTYVITVSRDVQDTAGRPMIRNFRAVFTTKVNRIP